MSNPSNNNVSARSGADNSDDESIEFPFAINNYDASEPRQDPVLVMGDRMTGDPLNFDLWIEDHRRQFERLRLNQINQFIRHHYVPHLGNRIGPESGEEEYTNDKDFDKASVSKSRMSKHFYKLQTRGKKKGNKKYVPLERHDMKKALQKIKNATFKPESGSNTFLSLFDTRTNDVANHLENFAAMCAGLQHSDSLQSTMSILFLYVKTFVDKSVCSALWQYLSSLVCDDESSQVPDFNEMIYGASIPGFRPESGKEIIQALKEFGKNFALFTTNPVFQKISYIINACVCAGLCEASSMKWEVNGVRLFSPNVYQRHVNAVDLIDAVISTITYFVEGGYEFFKSGSISGFMFTDNRISTLQDEYNTVRSYSGYFRTGMLSEKTGLSDHEYFTKLVGVIDELKKVSRIVSGSEKIMIERMLTHLYEVKVDFDLCRVQGGIRPAPYCIAYVGPPEVGKTVLTSAVPSIIGALNGYDGGPSKCATIRGDDKFQPNLKGDTTSILLDDLFNTKSDFLQVSPTDNIILIKNNAIAYANMPDVESKGKVPICPKLLQVTSNLSDMGASLGSNAPAAIERRMNVRVTVSIKSEFRKTANSPALNWDAVETHYGGRDKVPPLPDIWELHLEDPVVVSNPVRGGADLVNYRTCVLEGKMLDKCSIKDFIEYVKRDSRKFHAQQKELVKQSNELYQKVHLCPKCDTVTLMCGCVPCIPESGTELRDEFYHVFNRYQEGVMGYVCKRLGLHGVISPIVAPFFNRAFVKELGICACFYFLIGIYIMFRSVTVFEVLCILSCFMYFVLRTKLSYHSAQVVYYEMLTFADKHGDKTLEFVLNRVRERKVQRILMTSVALGVVYWAAKEWRNSRPLVKMMAEGNLIPVSQEDIDKRDQEVSNWLKPDTTPVHFDRRLMTHTLDQIVDKVSSNLCFMRVREDESMWRVCDALFIRSGICVVPYHILCKGKNEANGMSPVLYLEFYRKGPNVTGAMFKYIISPNRVRRVPHTDFAILMVASGGDMADITYMLTEDPYSGGANFVYKYKSGEIRREPAHVTVGRHRHETFTRGETFDGISYFLENGTGEGLCMGTFVSTDRGKRIVGFHLGGNDTGYGIGGILTKEQFTKTLEMFPVEYIVPHSSTEFPETTYGMPILTTTHINKKSPVNFLLETGSFNVYGSCHGGVTNKSRVVKSLISDTVHEVFGIPNTWGPPRFIPQWLPWHQNLVNLAKPSNGFRCDSLEWAKRDYLREVLDHMKCHSYAREMVSKIDRLVNVNGKPGVRFIDKLNFNTSCGFPFSGPKSQLMVDLGVVDGYENAKDFTDTVWDEVERIRECLKRGERAFCIWKAVLKDEATSTLKDKVAREINVITIALSLLCREYFLGLTRYMNMFPFLFESMVGINCMSPEWEQLINTLTRNGTLKHRTFAIDYGKFDQRLPAQLTFAAYEIFIEICMASGNYTEEDRIVMKGIATECCYPFVAFNGTLVSLNGSMVSGTTLTVYGDGVCSALKQRIGFKEIEVDNNPHLKSTRFRDNVFVGNYGDDGKGTISEDVKYYDMSTFADLMRKHDIVVTMSDKSSEMLPFVHWDDADFLKRTDNYIEEIGYHLGKLDKKSIFKSLHAHLRNQNLSQEELCVAVMESAVHEFFAWGKLEFDDALVKLKTIADRHFLSVPALHKTFEERCIEWIEKHVGTEPQVTELTEA